MIFQTSFCPPVSDFVAPNIGLLFAKYFIVFIQNIF